MHSVSSDTDRQPHFYLIGHAPAGSTKWAGDSRACVCGPPRLELEVLASDRTPLKRLRETRQ